MPHSCRYLCSQLVTVIYEEQPGELCQATANLEEISATGAVILVDEKPRLGSPIFLSIKDRDLFGVITSSLYDATLGWFVSITLDADSTWRRESITPRHLLAMCDCSFQRSTRTKVWTLETTKYTEENLPVSFVVRQV